MRRMWNAGNCAFCGLPLQHEYFKHRKSAKLPWHHNLLVLKNCKGLKSWKKHFKKSVLQKKWKKVKKSWTKVEKKLRINWEKNGKKLEKNCEKMKKYEKKSWKKLKKIGKKVGKN